MYIYYYYIMLFNWLHVDIFKVYIYQYYIMILIDYMLILFQSVYLLVLHYDILYIVFLIDYILLFFKCWYLLIIHCVFNWLHVDIFKVYIY